MGTGLSWFLVAAMATNEAVHEPNNAAEEWGSSRDNIQPDDADIRSSSDVQLDGDDIRSTNDNTQPNNDDIRREYHPNAHREPEVFSFDDYQSTPPVVTPPVEPEPWLPFKTREDFEFAEIALATAMTKAQVDATINLLHRCVKKGMGSFTLSNHDEMRKTLRAAADRLPKVLWLTAVPLLHALITHLSSLKRRLSHQNTKGNHAHLMCGSVQSGTGLKACCRTHNSSITLYGMHARCQSLMENHHHGSGFMMSHGLQHNFGIYRYALSDGPNFLNLIHISFHSQAFQMGPNQLFFLSMQISQNYPHLVPRRDTLLLLGVQTFQLSCEMEMVLEGDVLLVGSQLYVHTG